MVNKKILPKDGNDTFCMAPWTHTYVSPQGERRMCCASREKSTWIKQYIDVENDNKSADFIPTTIEDHWNSEYMKDIRKRLMAGEEIDQCQVCNHKLLNLNTYRGYFNNQLFGHKIDEAFEKTDETGYTEMKPISYDYRISNLCNFKCRMCGDQLSSSWESERRQMNNWSPELDPWMTPENRNTLQKFTREVLEKELWAAVKEERIEEIYWVGGEPLMFQIHWDIMKYLVETGQSKKVTIRYNTNLSRTEWRGTKLYDLLPHFKHVNISASIDGTGKIVEYVRDGIKWDKWLQNFKDGLFLKDLYGDAGIVLDVTLTAPGLFAMKDLFDLALELNVISYIKKTFEFDPAVVMSPSLIPRHILEPLIDNILDYMRPKVTDKTKIYIEALEDVRNIKTFEEKYPNWLEGLEKGKSNLYRVDKFRKCEYTLDDIYRDNNIELYNWWKTIPYETNF
jgi:organic radical activating enzyme